MVLYFNKRDLVKFGNYLRSKKRRQQFINHPCPNGLSLDERLDVVNASDIENWMESQGN